MNRLCLIVLCAATAAPIFGCGGDDVDWSPRALVATLRHVQTCDELLTSLREDAALKVQDEATLMKMSYDGYASSPGFWRGRDDLAWSDAGTAVPEADGPSHYTDTNTQVAGVDEPDFVKTDGHRIFVIHGRRVEVFQSWPAEETQLIGSLEVEGDPVSMFLAGEKLVVYSQVYFVDQDGGGGTERPAAMPSIDVAWGYGYPHSFRTFTKISVMNIDEDQPEVEHERYVEGYFRDARRHGDFVRTLVQAPTWEPQWTGDYPYMWNPEGKLYSRSFYFGLVDAWLAGRLEEIDGRELSGFLPDEYVVEGGAYVEVEPRCDRYLAPEPGQSTYGMTVALTTNLADQTTGDSLFILGNPSVIYASHDMLVLAQFDWSWFGMGWRGEQHTILHAFDLDQASTEYVGSAIVAGFVDNQFSIDEKDGIVRVAVTESVFAASEGDTVSWPPTTLNRVLTLEPEGGVLVERGRTPDLAEDERIFSTRYIGDRAYVVTFRQVDPLFVIDLADPTRPTVLGELKIPGFSTYMHPLSASHLLTIGRLVDENTGWDQGLQLQIFDVSDPTDPRQVQSHVISGYSYAEHDHKAFVYDPVSSLLAVPVDEYGTTFVSNLRLFHVSIEDGFSDAGSIDHSPLFSDCVYEELGYYHYGCGYSSSMRRGIFIDSFVYALSYGGLSVHALGDVEVPLVVEALPPPEFYPYPYVFDGVGVLF
jgi:hypothetical protein